MIDSGPSKSIQEQLAEDPAFAEELVQALVAQGRSADGQIHLERLEGLPADKALLAALNARQGSVEPAVEQVRLARLYGLAGQTARAAKSLRLGLQRGPLSLSLAVTLAEDAAAGGDRVLALGILDWLAMQLTRRDDRSSDHDTVDPVRRDPRATCDLLRRAGEVALAIERPLRCVALMRTAANRLERMGLMEESDACFRLGIEALRRAGHPDKALDMAMRLRPRAKERKSIPDEAHALGLVSELMAMSADSQDADRARTCRREASKLLTEEGDHAGALEHLRALAALEAQSDPSAALKTLEGAITRAQTEDQDHLACALILDAALLELRLGKPGKAMARAESVRKDKAAGELAAQATLVVAEGLIHAGDAARARKALSKFDSPWGEPHLAAWGLRVRGELAALEGRASEARALLRQAWRLVSDSHPERAARCALLAGLLAHGAGDTDAAREELDRARRVDLRGPLEVRAEVLAAVLSDDPDEREILLDDAQERAGDAGDLEDRVVVGVEQARIYAEQGSVESAREVLEGAVNLLLDVRAEVPGPLRGSFQRSRLCAVALRLRDNDELADALAPLDG